MTTSAMANGPATTTTPAAGATRLADAMRAKLEAARINAICLDGAAARNVRRYIDELGGDLARLASLLGGEGPGGPQGDAIASPEMARPHEPSPMELGALAEVLDAARARMPAGSMTLMLAGAFLGRCRGETTAGAGRRDEASASEGADDGLEECDCVELRPFATPPSASVTEMMTVRADCPKCRGTGLAPKVEWNDLLAAAELEMAGRTKPIDDGMEDCACVEARKDYDFHESGARGRPRPHRSSGGPGHRLDQVGTKTAAKGCPDCGGSGRRRIMGAHKPTAEPVTL